MNTWSYLDFSRANLLPITLNDRHHYDGLRTYREFIPLLDGRWEVRHRCRGHVPQWCERCGNVGCVGDCDYEQITEQELIRILDSAAYRGSGIWTELRPAGVCPACGSFNCIEKNCTPQILDDDQVANRWSWSIGLTRAVLLEEGSIHV